MHFHYFGNICSGCWFCLWATSVLGGAKVHVNKVQARMGTLVTEETEVERRGL